MPRKITSVTWECALCEHEHRTRREAVACECKGIVSPRFRVGQKVRLTRPNGEWAYAMVCQLWTEYFYPFVHDGTITYIICLEKPWAKGHYLTTATADELETSGGGSAPDRKPARNWAAFWKLFGRNDRTAQRTVRKFVHQRKVRLPAEGEPKFR